MGTRKTSNVSIIPTPTGTDQFDDGQPLSQFTLYLLWKPKPFAISISCTEQGIHLSIHPSIHPSSAVLFILRPSIISSAYCFVSEMKTESVCSIHTLIVPSSYATFFSGQEASQPASNIHTNIHTYILRQASFWSIHIPLQTQGFPVQFRVAIAERKTQRETDQHPCW